MQARGVYEFYMHEHNLFLNIIVELRRNTVEIVLDFLCKKYTLGINLVYCAANSNFQCNSYGYPDIYNYNNLFLYDDTSATPHYK